jgi:hypothetical protein
MTEQVTGIAETSANAPSSISSSSHVSSEPEKTLTQSEVNRIVGGVKDSYFQRGREAALRELGSSAPQAPEHHASTQQQVVHQPPALTRNDIETIVAQKSQEMAERGRVTELANSFVNKLQVGSGKYSDFESVVAPLNLPQIPAIWQAAASFDNPADLVYELGKNPSKLASLMTVSYSPELVRRELSKLSESIKETEKAKEAPKDAKPVGRISPSIRGVGSDRDPHELSPSEWRKISRR